ncbi:MAG: nuclear transport factor 2 family protein [Chloroflexi bacterium]|nr:nuclear transport factor 2 family protein [Chloroflexota bacterium]
MIGLSCGGSKAEIDIEATVQAAVRATLEPASAEAPIRANAPTPPRVTPTPESPSVSLETPKESSPEDIASQWVEAFNGADIDALTALYTNDVVFDIKGDETLEGKAEVLGFNLEYIQGNGEVSFYVLETDGSSLNGEVSFVNGDDPGDDISGFMKVEFEGGRIARMVVTPFDDLQPLDSSESSPEETRTAELSFFEEELVGLWSRYHSYDGSTRYIRFNEDRTACKWEEAGGSNKRKKVGSYPHWEVNEDNPIRENRFNVIIEKAGIIYSFDYPSDQLWPGSYTNLKHGKSSSGKTCEE